MLKMCTVYVHMPMYIYTYVYVSSIYVSMHLCTNGTGVHKLLCVQASDECGTVPYIHDEAFWHFAFCVSRLAEESSLHARTAQIPKVSRPPSHLLSTSRYISTAHPRLPSTPSCKARKQGQSVEEGVSDGRAAPFEPLLRFSCCWPDHACVAWLIRAHGAAVDICDSACLSAIMWVFLLLLCSSERLYCCTS